MDDYEAEEEDEISFPKGAVVDVLQKRLDGWWFVKHEDRTGLAPATFLRKGQPPAKPELVSIGRHRLATYDLATTISRLLAEFEKLRMGTRLPYDRQIFNVAC